MKRYENDIIIINAVKKSSASESIKSLTKNKGTLKTVNEEIKVYTEQDHVEKATDTIDELYEKFKSAITNLSDDILIIPKKQYMAFNKEKKNYCGITILTNSLKIFINLKAGELDDPKQLAKDVSKVGHWGNGDYQLQVEDDAHLEYILSLIKQAIQ